MSDDEFKKIKVEIMTKAQKAVFVWGGTALLLLIVLVGRPAQAPWTKADWATVIGGLGIYWVLSCILLSFAPKDSDPKNL